jgi:hypothetical protein
MNPLPEFIHGLDLCERFFREAVRPILSSHFSTLVYSAGRLERGSDVLGFDTPQSRDHDWGPRVTLFLSKQDLGSVGRSIRDLMSRELPLEIAGYPTHFADLEVDGGSLQSTTARPIDHGVTAKTVEDFTTEYLGVDATQALAARDWLAIPAQRLRTLRSGRVFHDGLDQLERLRRSLQWYPHDVWLYLMANQWRRVDQEEPFVGRCGDVDDDLGSRLIAARQIIELMRLAFLMEREYAPYSKWFGSAFARLQCADELIPIFTQALNADDWKDRESWLSKAYRKLGEMHNRLEVTERIEIKISRFHSRPYMVPHSERFVSALHKAIESQTVRELPKHVGGLSQFVDSTDVQDSDALVLLRPLRVIYDVG